jgi:septum formation protein
MGDKIRIVLASSSPRRDGILNQLGLEHVTVPSEIDERSIKEKAPRAYAKKLAVLKASKVAPGFKDSIVIGADTLVITDNKVFGKPKDKEDAVRMLGELSGRTHRVITALCVIDTRSNERIVKLVSTSVRFRKLDNQTIKEYVGSGEPLGKAGAYAIQGRGAALVESINGDFYNVVGLPVPALMGILERLHASPRSR